VRESSEAVAADLGTAEATALGTASEKERDRDRKQAKISHSTRRPSCIDLIVSVAKGYVTAFCALEGSSDLALGRNSRLLYRMEHLEIGTTG